MNLLLINHYAGAPGMGMEYRPYYLAREWVRAGHRVQVVAASYSHVRSRQPRVHAETIDGIAYRWLPTPRYSGNGFGRLRNIAAFLGALKCETRHWVEDFAPDAVIASSTYPMDVRVAKRIARRAGAVLVYEVHDLWPLSLVEVGGMSRWHPFVWHVQRAENAAYRDADVVVSMLPKVHEHMAAHGLDLRKLCIVPNGVAVDDWRRAPQALRDDVAAAIAAARASGRTVVGYAGSMGLPNALDVLLDAAKVLQDEAFEFVLVGDGHERRRLVRRIADEGLKRVRLLPPIPKAQVPGFLAAIDIAYIGWQRAPIYRFGIAPNKLLDYMMSARPVLHSVDAGNDPVAESGCGLTVAPQDPAAVADGLRRLGALSDEERRSMGLRGRDFVVANHAYDKLAQRFIDALQAARR